MTNFKQTLSHINPLRFRELATCSLTTMINHLSKLLLFALIIMFLIWIPTLIKLPTYFENQLGKFQELGIRGNMDTTEPVTIPDYKPQLVMDTSGTHSSLGNERFLITEEGFFYRFFNKETHIAREEFEQILDNKTKMSTFLTLTTIFLLPSVLFFIYGFFWIKYLLTILLFGTIFYILLDLTHYRLPWKHMMGVAGYASFPMILLEIISLPINTNYLLPILQIFGVNIYLIPLLLYTTVMILATTVVQVIPKKHEDR